MDTDSTTSEEATEATVEVATIVQSKWRWGINSKKGTKGLGFFFFG
jgi:hypothetical protein